jgi:hypothetical protein
MGCSTSTTSEQNSAPAVVETTQTLIQPTPIAVIPAETKTVDQSYLTYTNEYYRISIPYPDTWEKEEPNSFDVRDYGENTINIVNFFSPGKVPCYATFSIDVDTQNSEDLEQYYNTAVLDLQKYYRNLGYDWKITKHNAQFAVSGNPAYRLEFEIDKSTGCGQGTTNIIQIYTMVKGTPYIITYDRGPDESGIWKETIETMIKSMKITSPQDVKQR